MKPIMPLKYFLISVFYPLSHLGEDYFVFIGCPVNFSCPFCLFSLLFSSVLIPCHHFSCIFSHSPINMSPAALKSNCYGDIFCDTCSKHEACWAARRTEGGLSGMAGLASITMPIETAAQSSVLHSQIRPPDKKGSAARLHSLQWRGENRICNS